MQVTYDHAAQRRRATARSAHVRAVRHRLLEDVRAGRTTVAAILRDPPEEIGNAYVLDVLRWPHRRSSVVARQILARVNEWTDFAVKVGPNRRVRELTDRERMAIVEELER